jgi:lipopolysaccharide/colanic/teichoic acid biosynthesis glycosyltransferase
MILNLIKGDLKLVGVRPLSKHYFSLYPHEMQKKRTKFKPGLIPPFYVDLPKTFEEIVASESKYLDEYEKAPFTTDLKYFRKALWNILVKRIRSE